jgi:pyruvate-ferredoxin/flavodoxin oxidoreductase
MVLGLNETTAPLASYPYNAFAFPVSAQPAPAAGGALEGLLEGTLAPLADGFRRVRMAELELDGKYNPEVHDAFFARFGWRDFTAEEWALCPPVVLAGDESLLSGPQAGALHALLDSGRPVRVLCLDGHAWSALAAHPGTPPPFGEADPGTGGAAAPAALGPAEPALQAIMRGGAYVEQGSLADVPRLLEGFMRGLRSPRPALFTVFRASLPDHGRADAMAAQQSRLALDSRAHPWLRYDPDAGAALHERLSLAGNPAPAAAWATAALEHRDATGHVDTSETVLTFAHFALALPELAHHFTPLPPHAPEEGLVPLEEYLELDPDEQREHRPIVAAADFSGALQRWRVSAALVQAARQRREVWRTLRALTREDLVPVDEDAIAAQARDAVVDTVWRNLVELAQGNGGDAAGLAGTLQSMPQGGKPEGGHA